MLEEPLVKLRKHPSDALTSWGMTEDWTFDMEQYKTCTICSQTKLLEEFGFNNRAKQYYKAQCKQCDTKRMALYNSLNREKVSANKRRYYLENHDDQLLKSRVYREQNREKVKSAHKIWCDENIEYVRLKARNRKAQRKAATSALVTPRDIAKILSSSCIYCGSHDNLHLEHVIPLARGGNHSIGNLASACARCNLSKGKWFVMEWKLKLKKWGRSF